MQTLDLNGIWEFSFHPGAAMEEWNGGEEGLSGMMSVPGCFDALPENFCRRGYAVYSRTFFLEKAWRNGRLRIDGMGLRGAFRLDGRPLGETALPYTAFELETGRLAAGEHRLTAVIDNNFDAEKMKLFLPYYDFYAFGGFYHGVSLRLSDAENPLDRVQVRTMDFRRRQLEFTFLFAGETPDECAVRLAIDGEAAREYAVRGGVLTVERPDLALWSPESPVVHTLRAECGTDVVTESFGIREIRAEGKRILLNGEPLYLKGFNRHESHPATGAATTRQEMLEDLQHLKQLHANFIRGCHYPQSQEFLDLCDRMGFLVWEESLGWGNNEAQMRDAEFIRLQEEQTRRMVRNSFNHPSVIFFGFLNENESDTDAGEELCRRLAEVIRAERSGRLVTFACNRIFEDRAAKHMDVVAYNTYPGWIDDLYREDPMVTVAPNQVRILERFRGECKPEKPILVSEMGCCGIYGSHDAAGAQWSEEFQAEYLATVIDTVASSPEIVGICLWQLNDARSYHRSGANIRVKPLAMNLAGVYDQYRRAKLSARVVAEKFGEIR